MADDLSVRYGDLLTGSYDCVDRIVLNAYYPLGHNPGGFRTWWRRLHGGSEEHLDDTHVMRFAGRFARRVRAYAAVAGIPVIDCKRGERKHRIAEQYLASPACSARSPTRRRWRGWSARWRRRASLRAARWPALSTCCGPTTSSSTTWYRTG